MMDIRRIRQDFLMKVEVTTFIKCKSKHIENLINSYYKNEKHIDNYRLPLWVDSAASFTVNNDYQSSIYLGNIEKMKQTIDNGDWNHTVTWTLCLLCYDGIIPEGIYSFEHSA